MAAMPRLDGVRSPNTVKAPTANHGSNATQRRLASVHATKNTIAKNFA